MKFRRGWSVAWALVACLILFGGQWLPAAEAHAMLLSAYPAPGDRLDASPAEIRLTFSERVGPGSAVQLFGPQFRGVPGVQSGLDPAAPERLRAFPPQLPPDTYTVEWTAISVDGHAVSGSYAFAVKAPAASGSAGSARQPAVNWPFVAAPLGALAVGGAAWEFARRRRRARHDNSGDSDPPARADRPRGSIS